MDPPSEPGAVVESTADEAFVEKLRAVLPALLRQRPEIAAEIESQLRQVFASRDDLRAILERMDRQQAEWNERFDRQQAEWNERFDRQQAEWNERFDRQAAEWKATQAEWNERFDRQAAEWKATQVEWNERFDRQAAEWKATQAEWNRRHDALARQIDERIEQTARSLQRRLDGIGSRWGLRAEAGFREGLEALLRQAVPCRVERWVGFDPTGEVYGEPSSVEVDIAIADGSCTLVEVKSSVAAADVRELERVARFYERTERSGARCRRVMVTAWADEQALAEADKRQIEIYTGR